MKFRTAAAVSLSLAAASAVLFLAAWLSSGLKASELAAWAWWVTAGSGVVALGDVTLQWRRRRRMARLFGVDRGTRER